MASSRRARSPRTEAAEWRRSRVHRALVSACGVEGVASRDGGAATLSRQDWPHHPAVLPVSATTLARCIDGADVPMPKVLANRHLARIGGGLLFAATSNVPWAPLLARTFNIDAKACARCGGWLEVRAVVTDHNIARRSLDAIPTAARAPQAADSSVAYEPAFA